VPFTREGDHIVLPLTFEPLQSVLIVFNKTRRALPPRITDDDLRSATIIPVTGGPVPPPAPARPLIDPSPNKMLTLSPVTGNPFEGTCQIPPALDLAASRVILQLDVIEPEAAARITVNGRDAGGFIGKPLHLDVSRHVKHGENSIRIEPFAPRSARLAVLKNPSSR
jgi:hypothetical protein